VQAFKYARQGRSQGLLHQSCHSSRSLESYRTVLLRQNPAAAGCLLSRSSAELVDLAAAGKTTTLAGIARQRQIFADLLHEGVANGELG
jgi:hypothetical protein